MQHLKGYLEQQYWTYPIRARITSLCHILYPLLSHL